MDLKYWKSKFHIGGSTFFVIYAPQLNNVQMILISIVAVFQLCIFNRRKYPYV